MNAWRMRRPSARRIGMFCRFGSAEDSRPVGRHRLVIGGVDAAGALVDLLRQLVGVGRFELRQSAVVEHDPRQRVGVRRAPPAHPPRSRAARWGSCAVTGSCSFSNRICCSCFGRLDVERRTPASLVGLLPAAPAAALAISWLCARSRLAIDEHAVVLHALQHRHQRLLDLARRAAASAGIALELRPQRPDAGTASRPRPRPRTRAPAPPAPG